MTLPNILLMVGGIILLGITLDTLIDYSFVFLTWSMAITFLVVSMLMIKRFWK